MGSRPNADRAAVKRAEIRDSSGHTQTIVSLSDRDDRDDRDVRPVGDRVARSPAGARPATVALRAARAGAFER